MLTLTLEKVELHKLIQSLIIIIIVATYIAQHSVRKDAHGAERKKIRDRKANDN